MMPERGPSTRAIQAGLPEPAQGEPFLPGPVFAAPFHLQGPADATRFSYERYTNPTWTNLEAALGELEGGEARVLRLRHGGGHRGGGAARCGPATSSSRRRDGYPGIRSIARRAPRAPRRRGAPGADRATARSARRCTGRRWSGSSRPRTRASRCSTSCCWRTTAHAAGATFVVDNTLATPLRQRPLELGADLSVSSASKSLTGHSDLVLGYVAATDVECARTRCGPGARTTGAIPGAFEAWLAHRSLATLAVRLERQEANAAALADALRPRDDVEDVRWPRVGSVLCFTLADADRAQAFLDATTLVTEATSFGGLHSTAERRARWGTDDVAEGCIRFSAGIEDTEDLVADVAGALDATR